MRGLTALERRGLAMGYDEPLYDAAVARALRACVEIGRVAVLPGAGIHGCDRLVTTDLGLLALRVCPVDES
jgi:hypothetical protein